MCEVNLLLVTARQQDVVLGTPPPRIVVTVLMLDKSSNKAANEVFAQCLAVSSCYACMLSSIHVVVADIKMQKLANPTCPNTYPKSIDHDLLLGKPGQLMSTLDTCTRTQRAALSDSLKDGCKRLLCGASHS
jgi:hypothetical protein